MPTASQIARQAGFSVRSIFERFSVLRALILATADYAIAQGQSEAVARNLMATGRFAFSPVLINLESWGEMRHKYDLSMEAAQVFGGLRSTGCCRRPDNRRPFDKLENQLGRPV